MIRVSERAKKLLSNLTSPLGKIFLAPPLGPIQLGWVELDHL